MKTFVICLPEGRVLWLLLLIVTRSTALENLHINNLDCYNDYVTEMFCTWKVSNGATNCSEDFQLEYNHLNHRTSSCVPENIPLSDLRSPNECICHIVAEYFVAADIYNIHVTSHGTLVHNVTIEPANKVKPKTPANVTIQSGEEEAIKICWDSRYTSEDYLFQDLNFEIQTITIQEPEEIKVITLHQAEYCNIMKKRLLRRGQDYIIKVRSKPNGIYYNGVWSEWSPGVVWHNDYDLQSHDIMVRTIPLSASLILICILLYSAASYLKRRWQRKIPDPARSHLSFTLMNKSQVSVLKSETSYNNIPIKEKINQDKTICGNLITTQSQNLIEGTDVHKMFLIPETAYIEKTIDISPLHDNLRSLEESVEEHDDDTSCLRLECDLINMMFLEILESDTEEDMVIDEESVKKEKDARFYANTSDLVHNSYTSENTQVKRSQNVLCLGEKLREQKDSRDCSPGLFMDYSYKSCITNINMDYEPNKYLHTVSRSTTYLDKVQLTSNSSFNHYQLKSLFDHPMGQIKTTNSSNMSPSLYQVSDYQSFDTEIIQLGKSETHINYKPKYTGYQSFENLLQANSHSDISELDTQYHIPDTEDLQMLSGMLEQ